MNSHIEISKSALLTNLKYFRNQITSKTKLLTMVKANAYGHGLEQVSKTIASRVDFFGVTTLSEAIQIRNLNIQTPILICGPIETKDIPIVIKNNISISAFSLQYLKKISKYPIKIHLKINTGMNRLGISPNEVSKALQIIQTSSLIFEGIYTHFHSPESKTLTRKQINTFKKCVDISKQVFPNIIAHAAKTAAILDYPESHFDMVRLGIGLYTQVKPVLSWKTYVVQSRLVLPGETIGYSATYKAQHPIFTAVIPVGYFDGLDRSLSNTSPFLGRISMNFSTIQTPRLLKPETKINLIGKDLTAQELATRLNTIVYEIVTRLNPIIPRILVK